MGKNKKQIVTAEDPKKEEICQSDHILTPEADGGIWNKLKSKILSIKKTIYCLDQLEEFRYLIEDLSAWVFVKRLLIVVDNIIAAGLFTFFVIWVNNYLGFEGYKYDFSSSISKSISDINMNLTEESLYFLLYLILLWRAPRITKVMPLKFYFHQFVLLMTATFFAIIFLTYGLGYLIKLEKLAYSIERYPFVVPALRWSVLSSLCFYRRIYLPWVATTEWNREHSAKGKPEKKSLWSDPDDETGK